MSEAEEIRRAAHQMRLATAQADYEAAARLLADTALQYVHLVGGGLLGDALAHFETAKQLRDRARRDVGEPC